MQCGEHNLPPHTSLHKLRPTPPREVRSPSRPSLEPRPRAPADRHNLGQDQTSCTSRPLAGMDCMDDLHVLPDAGDASDGLPDNSDHGHTWTPPEGKVGATSHHIAALRKAPTVSLGTPAYYMICETVTITCPQGNHQVILLYDRGSNDSLINSSFECCMPSHHKVVTLKLMETEMRVTCTQVSNLGAPFNVGCLQPVSYTHLTLPTKRIV